MKIIKIVKSNDMSVTIPVAQIAFYTQNRQTVMIESINGRVISFVPTEADSIAKIESFIISDRSILLLETKETMGIHNPRDLSFNQ